MTTVHLDATYFEEDGYWVMWSDHDSENLDHGRVGSSPRTEHEALELLESMHDDLAAAGFNLDRSPQPAMLIVHATVDDIERVTTGQDLRSRR